MLQQIYSIQDIGIHHHRSPSRMSRVPVSLRTPVPEGTLVQKGWWMLRQSIIKGINELYHDPTVQKKKYSSQSVWTLLYTFLLSHFDKVCFLFFIINHLVNGSLLSLLYPMSIFLYALLENPVPLKKYWKAMIIYSFVQILLKFIYQLPIFCGTPAFTLVDFESAQICQQSNLNPTDMVSRIDYFLGIRKYSGQSSYPKDQGF